VMPGMTGLDDVAFAAYIADSRVSYSTIKHAP
jgi:hypothetical protein